MFKNLEERYLSNASKLYSKFSTKDPNNGNSSQPFLEYKPDAPNRTETSNDKFSLPIGSTSRDITRLSRFLSSGPGVLFLATQAGLQTAQTFTETRVINPLFIVENAVPFIHSKRALASAADFAVTGDNLNQISPASLDPNIQSAGRLQQATAEKATATATGINNGATGLLSLLPPNSITNVLSGIFSVSEEGALGANTRPELNVNGEYFSIAMWQGFQKGISPASALSSIESNLRVGNIAGAVSSIVNGITNIANNIAGVANAPNLASIGSSLDGRENPDNTYLNGRRYFISTANTADKYIINSTSPMSIGNFDFTGANVSFVSSIPNIFSSDPVIPPIPSFDTPSVSSTSATVSAGSSIFSIPGDVTDFAQQLANSVQGSQQQSDAIANNIKSATKGNFVSDIGSDVASFFSTIDNIGASLGFGTSMDGSNENPAESAMQFPALSLAQRYANDARLTFIKGVLEGQKNNQFDYWQSLAPNSNLGFRGDGPKQGTAYYKPVGQRSTNVTGRYLSDTMNQGAPIMFDDASATKISSWLLNQINQNGKDLIQLTFFDYVNSKVVPLRAFLNGISENVTPTYSDTRYIGRVDRNIVYTGVSRELTFTIKLYAFSSAELDGIWAKINYLTGLCFPAMYDSFGFAVPPLIKLTMGDPYRDQPGYIRSLTHTVEDGTSWELIDGHQIPHGITVQVGYAILEKTQMNAIDIFSAVSNPSQASDANVFYPVGISRSGPASQGNQDNSSTILSLSDPLSNPSDTMTPGFPDPASAENLLQPPAVAGGPTF